MENFVNMPKTKRGMTTLNKIVNSAEKLFYKKGYHGTGINDITTASNVALGTFYIYFEDKMSIYRYLLVQYSHRIRMHIAKEIAGIEDRVEAERIGLKAFLLFIAKHKHIYNIIWESLYIDKKLFVDYYSTFAQNYARQIEHAQETHGMKNYDPEVVAFMMMGISNFIGLNYIMFKDEKDVDKVVDEVIKVLKEGLFT
ncbi:MAG: TetR/AcrR family transcriptional regulator [Erysipelotrichia bacterium]|jgi:AcrR family transcriptional regulator|nr:TetR/AcrR family transcriptional regulator [Erysipelotrichia bacterium]